MITIWHRTTSTKLDLFYNSGLIPIAIVDSDSLSHAANINRQNLNCNSLLIDPIVYAERSTSIGDILCRGNGECWQISQSDLVQVDLSLPHISVPANPKVGDCFDSFPTLNLNLGDSVLIHSQGLPNYAHGWFYLETRDWQNIATHRLLRTYK